MTTENQARTYEEEFKSAVKRVDEKCELAARETRGTAPQLLQTDCIDGNWEVFIPQDHGLAKVRLYVGQNRFDAERVCKVMNAHIEAHFERERVSQPVAPPPGICEICGKPLFTAASTMCSAMIEHMQDYYCSCPRTIAAEPVAPGASALAQSCEIITNLVEKLDYEGITETESDLIVRAKEFVRAQASPGAHPPQEGA